MRKDSSKSESKKLYQKPQVRKVKLTPEDAVLAGCKLESGTYTGAPTNCYKNRNFLCSASGS
jgi:hypothetical protein